MDTRAVVQTVPAGRVTAIASALIALIAFAVALIIVHDRARVVVTTLLGAVIWGGLMVASLTRMARRLPPPLRVQPDELPRKANPATALIPGIALFAIVDAVILFTSIYLQHSSSVGTALGIMLGGPIVLAGTLVNARRTERELGGTLWSPPTVAWTAKNRIRYLVSNP